MLNFPFVSLFIFILFFGSTFSLCSVHWFGIWLGLEMNLIGFIPIMVQGGKSEEVESSIKYFLTQAVASALLLLTTLLMFWKYGSWELNSVVSYTSSTIILSSLLMKMGMSPFHFWVPGVVSGLSWFCNMLLLTWQKIVPLFLVCFFFSLSKELLTLLIILSSFFGGVGGMNQTSVRGILAYSSILHMGWMVTSSLVGMEVCFLYFMLYSLILVVICGVLMEQETKNNKQFFSIFMWKEYFRAYVCLMILSMGGMPPMLGFFMKWLVLTKLIMINMILIPCILIIGSMISLYYYLILSFSIIMSHESTWKLMNIKSSLFLTTGMMMNLSGLFLIFWLSTFI